MVGNGRKLIFSSVSRMICLRILYLYLSSGKGDRFHSAISSKMGGRHTVEAARSWAGNSLIGFQSESLIFCPKMCE